MNDISVQERYAPKNRCFSCGPSNDKGLRIQSFASEEGLICQWTPQRHHEAFDGMVNGGIIGTLMDCHCNWTAAMHLMEKAGSESPPCTVTAAYSIKLMRPTPSAGPLTLHGKVVESTDDRAVVEGSLVADGKECASCRATFVAVKPGHPAYHRW